MRRYVCWLLIFVVAMSLLPIQVRALDEGSVTTEDLALGESSNPQQAEQVRGTSKAVEAAPITNIEVSQAQSVATPPQELLPISRSQIQPLTLPETTPDSVITTFDVSSTIEFVEVYNQSSQPVDMSGMKFRASTPGGDSCELGLSENGWLLANEYLTISSPTAANKGTHVFSNDCQFNSDITRLEVYYRGSRIQLIDGIATDGHSWMRHSTNVKTNTKTVLDCTHKAIPTTMRQTGSASDYVRCQNTVGLYEGTLYVPPVSHDLRIVEILPNSRSCLPSDSFLDCSDYIKVKNISGQGVNLADFRVRSGAKYSSATVSTSFNWHQPTLNPARDELILPAGQYFLLRLRNDGQIVSLSASQSNVWIEDYYGVQTYDEAAYNDMDLAAASGRSWAYDANDQTWKFGVPSPYGDNSYPDYEPGKGSVGAISTSKPCRDDQYRSEETNRCRNIVSASAATPCKEGQYRSEETNRCRSIASTTASLLKPCADDQFRNPASGRCKKIASSDDAAAADCGEGRERNPDTHRCRNVLSSTVPAAAFAIEPVKETGKAFIGWWALGGVGIVALGYGVWEWRREMRAGIRKIGSFFTSGK